ncbi:MAG TPA: hypothetical protein DCP07_00910 [Lachnospiraceae bacterium]|nr:hypothetical protein [Lachnospiraceae bacterium]
MLYNVSLECIGILIIVVVWIFHAIQYKNKTELNRYFRGLVVVTFLSCSLDVATGLSLSFSYLLPVNFNIVLNCLYFSITAIMTHFFTVYIRRAIGTYIHRFIIIFNHVLLVFVILTEILNCFYGFYFYFDENRLYTHGDLYYTFFVVSFYYIIFATVTIILGRKKASRRQVFGAASYVILDGVFYIVQTVVFPNVLLVGLGVAFTILIVFLLLETPDYYKLNETLEELEKAKEEAENANKSKSAFLANMSHEIRTPINGIMGLNEAALRINKDPDIENYLLDMHSAGKTLLNLVNEILDFSKIEAGKMEIIKSDYNLTDVIRSVYNIMAYKAKDKNLDFQIENDSSIPNILYGDESRIKQIMINLLNNAIIYTECGWVVLKISMEHLDPDNINLVISVEDTGIGISEDNQKLLFEAFKRVDTVKNRHIEGTGLGLRITKQLVTLMGGEIFVSSAYGKGSTFTARIPQRIVDDSPMGKFNSKAQVLDHEENAMDFSARDGKILIVDDVDMNIKVMKALLRPVGIQIDSALSGEEALNKLAKTQYDIVFLDHMMPGIDGMEVFDRHKKNNSSPNKNTPIIVLTANAIAGMKEEYLGYGFDDYLSKPVEENKLFLTLKKYLPQEKIDRPLSPDEYTKKSYDDIEEDNSNTYKENQIHNNKKKRVKVSADEDATKDISLRDKYDFLDVETGLKFCAGKEDFYEKMIQAYIKQNLLDKLKTAYENKSYEEYRLHAHSLKSTSHTIGAMEVFDLATKIDAAVKAKDLSYVDVNHEEFEEKYGSLLQRLKDMQ